MRGIVRGLVLAAGLALAACASVPNPVSTNEIYQLENAYGVLQSAAVAYVRLPKCRGTAPVSVVNICSQPAIVKQLASADLTARQALSEAENFVRTNPTLSAVTLLTAARAAVDGLRRIETVNAIR